MNIYKDNTFPLVLLLALSFNQLSTITNIPIILNPVKNLANVQTKGSTNTTCTSELNDANEAKAANNGAYPPDLSLIVKARVDGYNYLYSLLKGYEEEMPNDLDIGDLSYNPWYPGGAIAMYQPLYDESVEYEDGTQATIDQMSYDVTNFLAWAAEPTMEERKRLGFIVMGFLIIFFILMYLSVNRLFRDVH